MSAGRKVTVWLPVNPEHVREKLLRYGAGSPAYLDDCERELADMGYRFDREQLAKLRALTDEYLSRWDALAESIVLEHVGPPKGKVPPPGAIEHHQRTGKCMVTVEGEDPPGESRSRH
jgi:hypothetical protein